MAIIPSRLGNGMMPRGKALLLPPGAGLFPWAVGPDGERWIREPGWQGTLLGRSLVEGLDNLTGLCPEGEAQASNSK